MLFSREHTLTKYRQQNIDPYNSISLHVLQKSHEMLDTHTHTHTHTRKHKQKNTHTKADIADLVRRRKRTSAPICSRCRCCTQKRVRSFNCCVCVCTRGANTER